MYIYIYIYIYIFIIIIYLFLFLWWKANFSEAFSLLLSQTLCGPSRTPPEGTVTRVLILELHHPQCLVPETDYCTGVSHLCDLYKLPPNRQTLRSLVSAPANISERSSCYCWSFVYDLGLFTWPCDSLPPALVIWYLDCLLLLLSAACPDLSLVIVYEFDPVSITPVAGIRSLPV